LIDVLPKGSKFDSVHYLSHILSRLPEILVFDQDDPRQIFVFDDHFVFGLQFPTSDTSSSSFAKSGPSDFWFFGDLKGLLQEVRSTNLTSSCPISRQFGMRRLGDVGYGISRMDDPIAKIY
jgi:hypothetical protein